MERWRPVPGWEWLYEVSDQGRVRSLPRVSPKNGRTYGGKVLRPATDSDGYQIVTLAGATVGRSKQIGKVHRLVLEAFVGPCPDGMESRHLNGVRTDNRVRNLVWGTPAENTLDKFRHGTVARGSSINTALITEAEAPLIRERLRRGDRQKDIARDFGVTENVVWFIATGRTWRHVPEAA